jgi:hypothetical protein
VSSFHKEARDGLVRAFVEVLSDRHPNLTWDRLSRHDNRPKINDASCRF